jgi:hypothetical protein
MPKRSFEPLSHEHGTYKTVKARIRPWLRPSSGGMHERGAFSLGGGLQTLHLTECIYQLVLESQLLHKTVNLLFIITN